MDEMNERRELLARLDATGTPRSQVMPQTLDTRKLRLLVERLEREQGES